MVNLCQEKTNPSQVTGLKTKLYIFILLNYNKLSCLVLGMYSF